MFKIIPILFFLFYPFVTSANYWEREIERFEVADMNQNPTQGQVLFIGSSSIRLWNDLESYFPNLGYINRGFGGSQVSDLIYYYKRIITKYRPSKIVIYSGDNDISNGKSPDQVYRDYQRLIWLIHEQISADIIILGIKPSPARNYLMDDFRKTNQLITLLSNDNPHVFFVDLFDSFLNDNGLPKKIYFQRDGLHLSREGYMLWRNGLESLLY